MATYSPQEPLPEYDSLYYQNAVGVAGGPVNLSVHTVDGHYALVTTSEPDSGLGAVRATTWYQRTADLRLIRHGEPEPR
jgi:hypothetical protein